MVASSLTSIPSSSPHFLSQNNPTSRSVPHRRISFSSFPISAAQTTTTTRPMAAASASSLYEVLGIPMGASYQEIKTAYRRLARVCHPDVVAINQKDSSADEFIKIHSAYLTLSDPKKRTDYDRNLFRKTRSPYNSSFTASSTSSSSSMSSAMAGFSRRTWETDQCW